MNKNLKMLWVCFVLTSSCSYSVVKSDVFDPRLNSEIRDAVKNVSLISKNLRNNPANVGGNENEIFEPSFYFSQKAVWMRHPETANICLIAFIASDSEFNESNWISFFHGFTDKTKEDIISKIINISQFRYEKICREYAFGIPIDYKSYKTKIYTFIKENSNNPSKF